MTDNYPNIYIACRKACKTNLAEAFAISAMLNYYTKYNKVEEGIKYIKSLGLEEASRNDIIKAFKAYNK